MVKRTNGGGGLRLLVLTAAFGGISLLHMASRHDTSKVNYQFSPDQSSAISEQVSALQRIIGDKYAENEIGQELLDGLDVNYKLKDGEKVQLVIGPKGACVYIRTSETDCGVIGWARKPDIDKYISTHLKDSKTK